MERNLGVSVVGYWAFPELEVSTRFLQLDYSPLIPWDLARMCVERFWNWKRTKNF